METSISSCHRGRSTVNLQFQTTFPVSGKRSCPHVGQIGDTELPVPCAVLSRQRPSSLATATAHTVWVCVPLCVGHCSWGLQRCMFLWSVPAWGLFWSQWPSDICCLLMYPSVYISGLASNISLSGKPDALQLEFWDENQEFLLDFWDVLYILWMPKNIT